MPRLRKSSLTRSTPIFPFDGQQVQFHDLRPCHLRLMLHVCKTTIFSCMYSSRDALLTVIEGVVDARSGRFDPFSFFFFFLDCYSFRSTFASIKLTVNRTPFIALRSDFPSSCEMVSSEYQEIAQHLERVLDNVEFAPCHLVPFDGYFCHGNP